jgi:hypothetical protein
MGTYVGSIVQLAHPDLIYTSQAEGGLDEIGVGGKPVRDGPHGLEQRPPSSRINLLNEQEQAFEWSLNIVKSLQGT